ncbi:MAG: IgGFc-binding protein [Bacteroidetes bacterium]|nr:IgGFc-binding protein [Bacteroidota bacterium]MCL2301861.1 IgGFc-binding protein [Lentimicrobiaceae bacterium]
MKTIKYFLLTATLFVLSIFSLQAQSTEGKEFWLTFGQFFTQIQPASNTNIEIRIVGSDQPTSGRIYFTNLGTFENFSINANEVFTHSLDLAQKIAVYNSTVGVSNRSVYIISYNAPVTVYAFIQHPNVVDEVTYVLPVTALGAEYYHISNYTLPTNYKDAYAIVATQNNTHLYHNKEYIATLNAGQVYYNTSSTDMTGAQITSTNPVAYFTVHQYSPVPYFGFSHGCILVEQMAPVNTWGKRFFVPVTLFEKDIVRIVVSQNNTNIEIEGGTLRNDVPGAQTTLNNLKPGDFVELDFTNDYNGCYIQANNPVGVCVYIANTQYTGLHSLPAMSWVPGIEQSISKALIAPFIPGTYTYLTHHYALVTTPTATRDKTMVSIGGALPVSLNGETWKEHSASGMSFCSVQLTQGNASYVFTNPSGVIIMGYGTGPNNYQLASYFYLAYSAMRDLDVAFYGNEIHFQDFKENPFCESLVEFRAEIDGKGIETDTIKWFINETEEVAERNKLEWEKTFSLGEYEIKMWVHFENGDTLAKTGTLAIINCNQESAFYANNVHHEALKDTTFCNKNVNFLAEIEGLHPTDPEPIKWYIDDVFETSQATWNKPFENGTYEIKLVVHYDNDTYATLIGTLKVQALWIKIRNVRY